MLNPVRLKNIGHTDSAAVVIVVVHFSGCARLMPLWYQCRCVEHKRSHSPNSILCQQKSSFPKKKSSKSKKCTNGQKKSLSITIPNPAISNMALHLKKEKNKPT